MISNPKVEEGGKGEQFRSYFKIPGKSGYRLILVKQNWNRKEGVVLTVYNSPWQLRIFRKLRFLFDVIPLSTAVGLISVLHNYCAQFLPPGDRVKVRI